MKYKSIVITAHGGPEVLKLVETELERPQPGQVQVRIKAAGVAFTDLSMRYGMYPGVPRLPYTPGYDVVGQIASIGEGVSGFQTGQVVAALTVTGGYAEYITLPEARLAAVPEGLEPAEAVSLVQSYGTAYQLLHRVASVRTGQSVLVHGAAGGVGSALLQLGKLADLDTYGTASAGKQDYVRSLGAIPIDYQSEDFVERIRQLTREGVNVVFDNVGGANLRRSRRTLVRGGRLVSYGFLASLKDGKANKRVLGWTIITVGLMKLIPDGKKTSFFDINPSAAKHPEWLRQDLSVLFQYLQQGKLRPHIAARFPLEQAAEAQKLLESHSVTGKIVLVME